MIRGNKEETGISLRTVNKLMIVITIVVSIVLLMETYESSSLFNTVSQATDDYIEWQEDAYNLMEASDYLTQEVQCYTVTMDREHLDNYFKEAKTNRNREKALEAIPEDIRKTTAYQQLKAAMNDSMNLMNKEYYAMALICKAENYDMNEYPEEIRNIKISSEDLSLSREQMIRRAQLIVHGKSYFAQKDDIRSEMNRCIEELKDYTENRQTNSISSMRSQLKVVRMFIITHSIGIMFIFYLTSKLGILPILKGVEKINDDSPIPEIGASEFRFLARSYNKMYDTYKESIAHLNYNVSHDKLTGLYNREGYEIIKDSVDISRMCLVDIDVDDFKQINDTYGHDVGDKILRKIADALRMSFRSEDYLCRIGGDEFVVIMIHTKQNCESLIRKKVDMINKRLADTSDGLPTVSISAGAAHGVKNRNYDTIYKNADIALYEAKAKGKKNYSFYRAS